MKLTSETTLIVPFYDLDPMNVVWHGNYVKYTEVARCDFFKKINYTYDDMKKDGIAYPVAKMELKFIKSAYFGQELTIKTELVEIEPALIFNYTIYDAQTKEKIFKAKSMQIGVDINSKESILEISQKFKKRLENYEK